jgi:predicted Zn-dependent protease
MFLRIGGINFFTCLTLTALAVFLAAPTLAQSAQNVPTNATDSGLGGNNVVVGTVYTPAGQPAARIRIRLTTATRGDRIGLTDEKGMYAFSALTSGSYTIGIDKEGDFEAISQNVDIVQLRGAPPQQYQVNIRLNYAKSAQLPPVVLDAAMAGIPQSAIDHYNKGNELARAGNPKEAIDSFKLALVAHPSFIQVKNELGVQYYRVGQLEDAANILLDALRQDQDYLPSLMNLGMVLVDLKRYNQAEPLLRKVVELNSESPVGHYFLGQALANQGKFDEAEKELVIALRSGNPAMANGHRILAIIYNSRGERKRAISELETYLKLAPDAADAEQLTNVLAQWKAADTGRRP